ncbi:Oligopeptide transport ATP-binding protein OppD [Burkholderiales bacterium]|nr:Oligopeptide transport ATP-binding protein OppD [Burkholderiales bacterium]
MSAALLEISGLRTWFDTRAGTVKAVDGVDLFIDRGEIVGLVGESGSGKSVLGNSIMRLIDPPGYIKEGAIIYQSSHGGSEDLLLATPRRMREIRGNRIAMIFQDPTMSLNPVLRIGTQMTEAVCAHHRVSTRAAQALAREALLRVGISSPDERLAAYPHQFSGGMRQRVAIATALINRPELIVADEPTTALDVTVQAQILHEVRRLCRESGTALLWVTHDLALVSGLADRIAVMYAGRIVESGSVEQVIARPAHPYTQGLLASVPSNNPRGRPLRQIPGMTPSLANLPPGCAFAPRCPHAGVECGAAVPLREMDRGHRVRCHQPQSPKCVPSPRELKEMVVSP